MSSCPILCDSLCRSWTTLIFTTLVIFSSLPSIHSSGFFELQFLEGVRNSTTIHVCLKEFWNSQNNVDRCTFGQKTIIYNEHNHPKQSAVRIPFTFRWIGSFSFTIQLSENSIHSGVNRFVVEDEFAVPAPSNWKLRTFHASDGRIISIRFQIDCDAYYHSEDCATFCRARNDTFGHYSCRPNGEKVCLDGWKGENCVKPKCRAGCNEQHGFCETPNECSCRSGWKGPNCDECVEYPGCLHGYCVSPFQCICHRNWGGILCDQDLNYCGTHEPCLNDGRCENVAPDNYRCLCKRGFSGVNCQVVEDACATSPCLHGGHCRTLDNGTDFQCLCRDGFTGKRCERDLNECTSQPCLNGGTCHDLENNYRCTCPSGWTGDRCELDVDECSALVTPCIHASGCINTNGSYRCICEKGFEGAFCEVEIDDCEHNQVECLNGGFCIDLANDYRCACATGFAGHNCQRLDQTVCESASNQVWHWNDTKTGSSCEQVCMCRPAGEVVGVACTCRQQLEMTHRLGHCADRAMVNQTELRVVFDHVLGTTNAASGASEACDTIFALHRLINGNGSLEMKQEKQEIQVHEFCCHAVSPNEIRVRVEQADVLARYLTRSAFPRLLHVLVDRKKFEPTAWWRINLAMITLFGALCLAVAYIVSKSYTRRKRAAADAENVVIHCIQNNLQAKARPVGLAKPRSLEASPVSALRLDSLAAYNVKMCNTLQRNWKVANLTVGQDCGKKHFVEHYELDRDECCRTHEDQGGQFAKTSPYKIKIVK